MGCVQRLNRDNLPLSAWLHAPDLQVAIASSSPELLLKQEGKPYPPVD